MNNQLMMKKHNSNHTKIHPEIYSGTMLTIQKTINNDPNCIIEIKGKTNEVGTGTKSASNPYELQSVTNQYLISKTPNMVENGNFKDFTGWTSFNSNTTTLNNTVNNVGVLGNNPYAYISKTFSNGIFTNRKMFGSCKVRVLDAGCSYIQFYLLTPTVRVFSRIDNPVVGQWYDVNGIAPTANDTGTQQMIILHRYSSNSAVVGKRMEVKDVTLVDMGLDTTNPLYNFTSSQMFSRYQKWIDYGYNLISLPYTLRDLPNGISDKIIIDNKNKTITLIQNIKLVTISSGTTWNFADAKINSSIRTNKLSNTSLVGNSLTSDIAIVGDHYVQYQLETPIPTTLSFIEFKTFNPETHIYTSSTIRPELNCTLSIIGT